MRILLWHGYLLGGHGLERLHAGARARVEPRRARRHRRLPGAAPGALRPRRRDGRAARSCRRAAARLRPRPLRGARGAAAPGLHARTSASATSRRTRPRCASYLPADLVFANHVLLGGAGRRRGRGARSRVKAHGSELEYSMRGNAGARGVGARGARATPRRPSSARRHIREVLEDVVGHVERVHEVPPGVDVDEFAPAGRATRRSPRCSTRRGATRRTPATRTSGCRTRATRSGWPSSSPATSRPSSTSASCSTTRASTSCSRRCAGSTRAP